MSGLSNFHISAKNECEHGCGQILASGKAVQHSLMCGFRPILCDACQTNVPCNKYKNHVTSGECFNNRPVKWTIGPDESEDEAEDGPKDEPTAFHITDQELAEYTETQSDGGPTLYNNDMPTFHF
jgi:hypothetical protein